MSEQHVQILKVSTKSDPKKVAGAIAELIRSETKVEVHVIGAGALNQANKALAIARGFVAPNGYDLAYVPAFHEAEVEGEKRTSMRLIVKNF